MRKLLFCVVIVFVGGVICGQGDEDGSFPDYWQSDYDNFYNYDFLKEESEKIDSVLKSTEDIPVKGNNVDKKNEGGIQHSGEENENDNSAKEVFDAMEDYQFEDNRQKSEEVVNKEENNSETVEGDVETLDKPTASIVKGTTSVESTETNIEEGNKNTSKELDANADYALLWGDDDSTPPLPLPIAKDDRKIFDETQEILNGDDKDDYGFEDEKQDTTNLSVEEHTSLEQVIDETKKILADNENQFEDTITSEGNNKNEEDSNSVDVESLADSDENSAEASLHEDLQELFNTFDKSKGDESNEVTEETNDDSDSLNVLDYEEKFDKPYKEGLVLSQRVDQDQDYELIDDSNLSEIFSKTSVKEDNGEDFEDTKDNLLNTESDLDNDLKSSTENEREDTTTSKQIMYENDALVDEEQKADSAEVEVFDVKKSLEEGEKGNEEENVLEQTTINPDENESKEESIMGDDVSEHIEVRKKMVDDLTSSELDDLMQQFTIFHGEDLNVHSEDFSKNIAPVHITLSVDEPVVVTSPNYPNPYPTNNIIDWIFEGEGMGIELNVTDFAVNGALGDYLLVKPGGVDETGHDGLVFSYRLKTERRFRFTDVNKMFVRFEAKMGMMFLRGFKFSVKLMSPLPEEPEEKPEPEAILTPPTETLTLHLGGVTKEQFQGLRDKFRELVADMAAEYISDNDIDPGMNITYEITQITNTALCNINWPDHENCASVTFGVPLAYEEEEEEYRLNQEDLTKMWRTYVTKDPFALRLRRMGITEFASPDESSVMMVWLVIAAGVLISMAMLAFALWRFSCFEDYTRMQTFSDTDSMKNEKRNLDLYPTPHQILPPLYSENDYKWADDSTRVDMGGFANRSYVRDELYDFDSEEEAVPSRDRFTTDV